MKFLYISHYGSTPKDFYCDRITGQPKKVIGDGGSNIHIHLISAFLKQGGQICFSTYRNHYQYLAFFNHQRDITYRTFWTPEDTFKTYNFLIDNLYKLLVLPWKALVDNTDFDYLISSTDFLPDVIYAFILKLRNRNLKWVASYFLEAPTPWAKVNPYRIDGKHYLTGVIYWSLQRLSLFLIKTKADLVLVTSKPDVKKFVNSFRKRLHILVVQGGVDIEASERYLKSGKVVPLEKRKYQACFVGRFHYQKGVLELVEIWSKVVMDMNDAKLVMIGNGPLFEQVRKKIRKSGLENNIELLGYQTGEKKFQIFKNSRIIVHPAIFDSGGMAAAEGMAWRLPGVSFDLDSLKTYYPKGMLKTKCFNLNEFAKNVLTLLKDKNEYDRLSQAAYQLVIEKWDWNKRAADIYHQLII